MAMNKVEICGVDTSTLPVISNERMRELFPLVHSGDLNAREEFIRGTLAEFVGLDEETLKGEMVIVIEGGKEEGKTPDEDDIRQALLNCIASGLSGKDAVEKTAKSLQVRKKTVYSLYLKLNQN